MRPDALNLRYTAELIFAANASRQAARGGSSSQSGIPSLGVQKSRRSWTRALSRRQSCSQEVITEVADARMLRCGMGRQSSRPSFNGAGLIASTRLDQRTRFSSQMHQTGYHSAVTMRPVSMGPDSKRPWIGLVTFNGPIKGCLRFVNSDSRWKKGWSQRRLDAWGSG